MSFRDDGDALLRRVDALERENERLRASAPATALQLACDPRLPEALAALRDLLTALRGAMKQRGDRIRQEDYYRIPATRYEGFYCASDDVSLFVALHLEACLQHGVGPLLVQLAYRDASLTGTRLADRWDVHDQKLLGWSQGPFVTLALRPGLGRSEQIEALLADVDAMRDALRQLDASD